MKDGTIKVGVSVAGLIVLFGGGWLVHERGIAENAAAISVEKARRESMKEQWDRMERKLDRLIEREGGQSK